MATNYLNNLNQEVVNRLTEISNLENKDSVLIFSKRVADDVSSISTYLNSLVVKSFDSLCSKPRFPYDTVESGISGLTIQTWPEAQGNNSFNNELFWVSGATAEDGRPATIKESFDYLLANMVDRIVEIRESTINLDELWDSIGCLTKDLTKVKRDVFGDKYTLNCNINNENVWPVSRHIYEILTQLTSGHTENNLTSLDVDFSSGSVSYPTLSLNYITPTLHEVLGAGNVSSLEAKVGKLTIVDANNATVFSLPQVDGSANQVLKTDGSGILSWSSDSTDVANATETIAGKVEIATSSEVVNGDAIGSTGAELVVTPDALISSIAVAGTLRNRIKSAALEQVQESSIDELEDVDTSTVPPSGGQVLTWNQEDEKWKPESLDAVQTEYLGSVGQTPTLGDVQNISGSNNFYFSSGVSLGYNRIVNKWENGFRGGSSNINLYYSFSDSLKGADYQLPGVTAGAFVVKKIPFTFYAGMLQENMPAEANLPAAFEAGNALLGLIGDSVGEESFRGFASRRTSKFVSSSNTNEIFYKNILGVNRNDLTHNLNIFEKTSNVINGNIESTFSTNVLNLSEESITNIIPVQKAGLSPIIVLGPYQIGDSLYICPEYLLSKAGIHYGIGVCIASSFFELEVLSASGSDAAMTMLEVANSTLNGQASYEISNYSNIDSYGLLSVGLVANHFIKGDFHIDSTSDSSYSLSNLVCTNLLGVNSNPANPGSDFYNKLSAHGDFDVASIKDFALLKYSLVLGEIKVR